MANDVVSIITPCYNGEKYLDRYFKSILAQTYRPLELIFINDGSTDDTESIALKYKTKLEKDGIVVKYVYQENEGQAAALNNGLKLFTGEYLTWPDSDDEMTSDCIEKKVQFLKENPSYGMVRSDGYYINPQTSQMRKINDKEIQEDIFEDLLLVHTYGCCGCYMITTNLFLSAYPSRNIFVSRCGQNWQMLVPTSSLSKCGFIDECLYNVYENPNSHSRNREIDHIKRWDDFTEILLECIKISKCDKRICENKVKENCARQQFYYAVSLNDKLILKDKFFDLIKYKHVTLKELLLFIKKYLFR